MGLTNSGRALGQFLQLSTPPKLLTLLAFCVFHKLISADHFSCFDRWIQFFFSDRYACVVFQNHKSLFFQVHQGDLQGSVLDSVLFCRFIDNFPASLHSSVSCSFYADAVAIWSSSPLVPAAVEATQGALIRQKCWYEFWYLSLNSGKCEVFFIPVDLHQANLQPTSFYSAPLLLQSSSNLP